ncbi:MAG: response regulator [Deltaproteobacteria bacterium]|nr:MAG: response regulator [Deltaproteobacteria bacterium]
MKKEAHILLIVYEHIIRDILARMLTERGHEVVTCSAATAGIRMFGKSKKKFDVVMSDIALPGTSGFNVAKQIKEMSERTPIILMKGPDKELDLSQFKESGADLVISRPFSMHNTVHLVEGLVEMETG